MEMESSLGREALIDNIISGKGFMLPKGGGAGESRFQVGKILDYMLSTVTDETIQNSPELQERIKRSTQISNGLKLYAENCFSCHNTGRNNTPQLGNKTDWQERKKQGVATLVSHVIHGHGDMIMKGGNTIHSTESVESMTAAYAAPQPSSNLNDLPASSFAGEQFCFDIPILNTGDTGYGPYLQMQFPPGITFASATFLEGPLVTQNIEATPIFQYGDTATGDNGHISGPSTTATVTPSLVVFEKRMNSSEGERPPGPSWPVTYELVADIANTKTISSLDFNDVLPTELQYITNSIMVSGGNNCVSNVVNQNINVICDDAVGTTSEEDVVVTFQAYIKDELDETVCSSATITNSSTFDAERFDTSNFYKYTYSYYQL
ncbi:Cytochrome c-555 [Nymphon striatum]|nr:Cytochrome c-555 [Nymphon striatum]